MRCGNHHGFFDGYLVDVTMDADSELLTGVNVLPANGDEGGDAAYLIEQEEAARRQRCRGDLHRRAGYRGTVLREATRSARPESGGLHAADGTHRLDGVQHGGIHAERRQDNAELSRGPNDEVL